jgi:predicted dehydrogenase
MTVAAPVRSKTRLPTTAKPRVGFLGVGWIGQHRLRAIAESGLVEIAALADPVQELVRKASSHAPDGVRVSTFDELLELDLDAVVIATPSAQHSAQSITALEQGLAVFCQKPLGRNLVEVSAVIDGAKRADRLLGVDLSYRFTAALQKIRALVRQGELGQIFSADLVFHNAYGPDKPWFYDPQQSGGGCVIDLGIHLVDAALWILGEPIVDVQSQLFLNGSRIERPGEACEDYATARLDLAGGTVVNLTCSWNLHAGQDAVIEASFYGTKGGASMRNVHGSFVNFRAERFTRTSRQSLSEPPDDWGGRAAVDWAQKLANGSGYDSGIEHLIEVTSVLDRIYQGAGHD